MEKTTVLMVLSLLLPMSAIAMISEASAQNRPYACEASPEVRQALGALPNLHDFRVPREERMKPLRAMLEKYPRDLFLQHRYQETFRRSLHLHEEFDRAFAMYRGKPDDPVFRYLEARLTGSFHSQKAEQMLNELIVKEPGFPWPHLAIAELTDRQGARDVKKAEQHLRAFLETCPASVEGYGLLRTVDDPEMIRSGAAKLRSLLEARMDTLSLPSWRSLWDLEFRASPKEEREAVRQRVLKDVASLQKLPPTPTRDWYSLFRYAADLTKEQSILAWLEETVLERLPNSSLVPTVERARWSRAHSRPGRSAGVEEQKAYGALEKARLEELAKRFPNDADVIWDRWFQVLPGGTSRPLEERLAIGDAYFSMMRRSPDSGSSTPPVAIQLANLYVQWRVRLDQVPELIRTGLRDADLQNKYKLDPSMIPEEARKMAESDPMSLTRWRVGLTLADLYLYQKKADLAREAIEVGLADTNPNDRNVEFRRREWLPRQARLALLEGDRVKALSLFRQYLATSPRGILTGELIPQQQVTEMIAEAKALYLATDGKEESWVEWATSGPKDPALTSKPAALAFTKMLADFEAKDLSGKTWRLADLKGKATFIDIWATWCGPCRAEHPELQQLQEKLKDRKDIQLLTVSGDETSYLAESYMKEHKYTFPVIVSKDLIDKLFPIGGFPQGWIVDQQGRSSYFRFFNVERTLAELDKAAPK